MNLRKTFLALGAMILGVGFFGASPASAHQTYFPGNNTGCKVYTQAGASWPLNGHFFLCDGTTSPTGTANNVKISASATEASLKAKLDAEKVDVFVFKDAVAVNSYIDFHNAIPFTGLKADDYGATWPSQGQDHPAPAIVVMKQSLAGVPYTTTDVGRTTDHEIGHAMDIVYGFPSGKANFNALLAVDIVDFNQVPNVNWAGLPSPSCTSKIKNMDKLLCWEQNNSGDVKEFFADLYASTKGGTIPPQVGSRMGSYFTKGSGSPQVNKYRSRQYVIDLAAGLRQP